MTFHLKWIDPFSSDLVLVNGEIDFFIILM